MAVDYVLNTNFVSREGYLCQHPVRIRKTGGRLLRFCLNSQESARQDSIRTPTVSGGDTGVAKDSRIDLKKEKKIVVEERWRQFFLHPSQWWDHRLGKSNAKYPDFKHKKSGEGLWVHDNANPPWVKVELAAIAPGTVQLPIAFWNRKLARYAREGQNEKTLELFEQIRQEGRSPDTFTFVPLLKACGALRALESGKHTHEQIKELGLESDVFLGTGLIDMYTKCGSLEDARTVFNNMPTKDVVTWTAMISGYAKCGQGQKALDLYEAMELEALEPAPATFVGVLNACASSTSLEEGRRVHLQIIERDYESNPFVSSSLVDMYAKCGSIDEAQLAFDKMATNNAVSWTALIAGHVKCGQGERALELYKLMQLEEVEPAPATFVGALNACASVRSLKQGRRIHKQIVKSGCDSNVFVGTSLVDMYAKCGNINEAESVFDGMATKSVASWNAMLAGFVKCGQGKKAIDLYRRMQDEGVDPIPTTFVAVLNACTSIRCLQEGQRVHAEVIQHRCESSLFVGSSLVDMYAKCGKIEDAWRAFNRMASWDAAAWTAMIMGYVYCGDGRKALALYYHMQLEGLQPAPDTFSGVLRANFQEQTL